MEEAEFEWDDEKRRSNLAKHGIDFEDALGIFETRVLVNRSDREGEPRFVAVVYTVRDGIYRIISARRGRRNEARRYHDRAKAPGG